MPSDPRDYRVEITTARQAGAGASAPALTSRPFLSVHFACCNVYVRIYRAAGASEYTGRCPRCGKAVKFPVGEGGTHVRTFRVE